MPRNIDGLAWYDELPAGSHDVVIGIFGAVAKAKEARDDHIVVAVLREAEANLREPRAEGEYLFGRFGVDADVYLRVNQLEFVARFEAYLRHFVPKVLARCASAGKDDALPVVALLHSGIEIAVLARHQEELLDELLGFFPRASAALYTFYIIYIYVLVEASERVMIVTRFPKAEVHDAQQLESLP